MMPVQANWHPACTTLLPSPTVPCLPACLPARGFGGIREILSKAGFSCVEFPSSAEPSRPQAPRGCSRRDQLHLNGVASGAMGFSEATRPSWCGS